ncbi:MAG: SRPBCC family protein [Actinomycetota bacterium]
MGRKGTSYIAAASVGAIGVATIAVAMVYRGLVRGWLGVDLGIGRSTRPLGPIVRKIDAPRDIVFDAAAAPYGPRPPKAARHHVEVLQRSPSMVIAAHRTIVGREVAITVEGVVFERPDRIEFRLVRGPVPHVVEEFTFEEVEGGTELTYSGELGTDLWMLGRAWGDRVAAVWEDAVGRSLEQIRDAAVRRARAQASRLSPEPGSPSTSEGD